jgi:dTDP-glucose pyrophosphorylase
MSSDILIDKAVILARGAGSRMRASAGIRLDPAQSAIADTGVKAMIPFGRPFLDFVLSGLADAGFAQACIVVGPEHDFVRDHYLRIQPRRILISFAVQAKALGTADAVLAAEGFASGGEFIVINSDNLYPSEVLVALRALGQPGAVMFDESSLIEKSNISRERVRSFAYATVDAAGYLNDLIEKPDERTLADLRGLALVSMNCWRFSTEIFDACRRVPLSSRGEYELPAAVREAAKGGMRFKIVRSTAGVLDLSQRSDIAAVAERLKNLRVSL